MGATLPAMARWVETTPEGVSWLGFFYGGNIAGARASAACSAGFYLLRVHDMAIATYVAVALNVARRGDRADHRADALRYEAAVEHDGSPSSSRQAPGPSTSPSRSRA